MIDKTIAVRLIPAHAGKTAQPANIAGPTPAHPRSRGENHDKAVPDALAEGSSPLTRGKPLQKLAGGKPLRLIPAHAGKTLNHNREQAVEAAHPRSRGENPDMSSRFR